MPLENNEPALGSTARSHIRSSYSDAYWTHSSISQSIESRLIDERVVRVDRLCLRSRRLGPDMSHFHLPRCISESDSRDGPCTSTFSLSLRSPVVDSNEPDGAPRQYLYSWCCLFRLTASARAPMPRVQYITSLHRIVQFMLFSSKNMSLALSGTFGCLH